MVGVLLLLLLLLYCYYYFTIINIYVCVLLNWVSQTLDAIHCHPNSAPLWLLAQLQHADVVVALRMVRIHRDGDLESLIRQAQVSHLGRARCGVGDYNAIVHTYIYI